MKIRTGFVSNSSSSSFIVGVGIVPEDRIEYFTKAYDLNEYRGMYMLRGWELANLNDTDIRVANGWVRIIGGGNRPVEVSAPYEPNSMYLVVSINNDEGDYAFMDDLGEIDYDIGLDRLHDDQQQLYHDVGSLDLSEITYGADRNG